LYTALHNALTRSGAEHPGGLYPGNVALMLYSLRVSSPARTISCRYVCVCVRVCMARRQ